MLMSGDGEPDYMHNKNNPDGCNTSGEVWENLPFSKPHDLPYQRSM